MTHYNLYLHHDNMLMLKYRIWTNDLNELCTKFATPCLKKGLHKGYSLEFQSKYYKRFMRELEREKFNCYKIKKTEIDLYLVCYLSLYKLKKIKQPLTDLIILKIKKK